MTALGQREGLGPNTCRHVENCFWSWPPLADNELVESIALTGHAHVPIVVDDVVPGGEVVVEAGDGHWLPTIVETDPRASALGPRAGDADRSAGAAEGGIGGNV